MTDITKQKSTIFFICVQYIEDVINPQNTSKPVTREMCPAFIASKVNLSRFHCHITSLTAGRGSTRGIQNVICNLFMVRSKPRTPSLSSLIRMW